MKKKRDQLCNAVSSHHICIDTLIKGLKMKITQERLKQIIKEEMEKFEQARVSRAFKGMKIGTETDDAVERHQFESRGDE